MAKKKKKSKGGSKKGTPFERQIAKELSLWWSDGERDDIFWRTDGSGARATKRRSINIMTANSCGDLGFLDVIGKPFLDVFVVEIKRGYTADLSVLNILDAKGKNTDVLLHWWRKLTAEARACGKPFGMIIFRRDHRSTCVCISYDCLNYLESTIGSWPIDDGLVLEITTSKESIVIVDYEVFFNWVIPDIFEV